MTRQLSVNSSTGICHAMMPGASPLASNIRYDSGNNPETVYFTDGHITKYVYSATGQKLRLIHLTAKSNVKRYEAGIEPSEDLTPEQTQFCDTTDYLLGGRLTLKNGKLKQFLFDGGYCTEHIPSGKRLQKPKDRSLWEAWAFAMTRHLDFHYYNQDHLGNVREVVDAKGTVKQVTNYYPFGAEFCDGSSGNNNAQPYKYNGKELDRMHGLDTYDYGARQYDPILARWDRIDPLAEKYYDSTPYAYCGNNPSNMVDYDGCDYWSTNDPEQIRAFLDAWGSGQTQFDFSNWQHATDAEFCANLTYNDETNKFYTSYSIVENGEVVVVGKSFNAHLKPVSRSGIGYPGAFVYQPLKGFWQIANHFWRGTHYFDGETNWNVNLSGRITGVAPIIGIVSITPEQKSKAVATLLSKGARLCKSFGRKHGEKVYKLGNLFYSVDNTSHNGGIYKVFKQEGGKLDRIGTADENLNIFKK